MVQKKHSFTQARRMGARQIYEALRDQVLDGAFGSEGQLPSSRALALELGVSRTTVTIAYEQLVAEGFIEVRQGARPRAVPKIADQSSRTRPAKRSQPVPLSAFGERMRVIPPWIAHVPGKFIVDFRYGDLSPSDFPAAPWKRAMDASMAQQREKLCYDDPRGSRRLRMALQGYLWRARTLRCDLEQIIVVNGSQQGLDLCARLILDPTDRFVLEDPCYSMARHVFEGTGASAVSVAVDQDGLNTELLAGIRAKLAYVTPSHQFPLGGVMPIARRHQLLEWARNCSAYVIEDDYDSEFRYDINPVPPLHGLEDGSGVIYLGTISKTLSPALRIGYLVVPVELQDAFATAKQVTDRHSPLTPQDALASLIESGAYERHVRRVRRLNGERRETLMNALYLRFGDSIIIEGADAGLHIVVWFKDLPLASEPMVLESARLHRVGIHSIARLYDPTLSAGRPDRVGLVLGYSALDVRRIERGVHLLADAVEQVRADLAM